MVVVVQHLLLGLSLLAAVSHCAPVGQPHVKRSALTATEAEKQKSDRLAYAVVHPQEEPLYPLDGVVAMSATRHDDAWPEDSPSRLSPLAAWLEALDRVIARLLIGTLKTTVADAYQNLDDPHRPSKLRFTLHRRAKPLSYEAFLKDVERRPSPSGIRHGGERECQGGLVPKQRQSLRKRWISSLSREQIHPIKPPSVPIWQGDVQCFSSHRHV